MSLVVPRHSVVGLVGESGSGKTLTALAVLGLLPRSVMRMGGEVRVNGLEVTSLNARAFGQLRAREIGYVPQDPLSSLNPVLRIGEQITESDRLHGASSRRLAGLVTVREVFRGYGFARKRGPWIDRGLISSAKRSCRSLVCAPCSTRTSSAADCGSGSLLDLLWRSVHAW